MFSSLTGMLRSGIDVALVLVGLGVVLQILFPDALAFINADVAGNLIDLINQLSLIHI